MVFLTIEDVGAWADKNGGEAVLREGLAVGRFGADRRALELVETWLKLKDYEYVEEALAAHIIAELSAMAAEKATKWPRVNRRILDLTETWLKLKDQGHDQAKQTDAFNAAERSAMAAEKAAKWTFWAVAAACGTAIILMQALIPLCENERQALMESSGNQAASPGTGLTASQR
jgi:prophage maintenance system killer protein